MKNIEEKEVIPKTPEVGGDSDSSRNSLGSYKPFEWDQLDSYQKHVWKECVEDVRGLKEELARKAIEKFGSDAILWVNSKMNRFASSIASVFPDIEVNTSKLPRVASWPQL